MATTGTPDAANVHKGRTMTRTPGTNPADLTIYHIRVKGHLGARMSARFDGLTITPEPDGSTLLTGPIVDQAALHSVLTSVRDLGLQLVSVMEIRDDGTSGGDGNAKAVPVKETNP